MTRVINLSTIFRSLVESVAHAQRNPFLRNYIQGLLASWSKNTEFRIHLDSLEGITCLDFELSESTMIADEWIYFPSSEIMIRDMRNIYSYQSDSATKWEILRVMDILDNVRFIQPVALHTYMSAETHDIERFMNMLTL